MKIVFGWVVNYNELVENNVIEPLKVRRELKLEKFALSAAASIRFGSKWFPKNTASRYTRPSTRRIYFERNCKTTRMQNNPLEYMRRKLNELNELKIQNKQSTEQSSKTLTC